MEYVDGGWSMNQVVKNITGLIAVFSIGYAGSALQKFAAANRGLSFSQFLAKAGTAVVNFIRFAPPYVQLACGVGLTATIIAIGS